MFDFENLSAYQQALAFRHQFFLLIRSKKDLDVVTRNQLRRASLSIVLNIAEGTSRFSKLDKRNFYVVSRGSIFECVTIMRVLLAESVIDQAFYDDRYRAAEELSKTLMGLIKSLS